MRRTVRILGQWALIFVLGVLLLVGVDAALAWLVPPAADAFLARYEPRQFVKVGPEGVWRTLPNHTYRHVKIDAATGALSYDVTYTTDRFRRRVTPRPPGTSPRPRPRFAAFFACSYVYGEGVQADETIPYYFGAIVPDYEPYNYGFHGHGPAEMLAALEDGDLKEGIQQNEGVLIYVFIFDHVRRTAGSMRLISGWGADKLSYALDGDSIPRYRGTFSSARPFQARLYSLLSRSWLLRNVDIPSCSRHAGVHLTAQVVIRARDLFRRQFPRAQLRVVLFPGSGETGEALATELRTAQIEPIDLSGLFQLGSPEYHLPYDMHTTPFANRLLASAMAEALGLTRDTRQSAITARSAARPPAPASRRGRARLVVDRRAPSPYGRSAR